MQRNPCPAKSVTTLKAIYLLDIRSQIPETSFQQVLLPIRKFSKTMNLANSLLTQLHL